MVLHYRDFDFVRFHREVSQHTTDVPYHPQPILSHIPPTHLPPTLLSLLPHPPSSSSTGLVPHTTSHTFPSFSYCPTLFPLSPIALSHPIEDRQHLFLKAQRIRDWWSASLWKKTHIVSTAHSRLLLRYEPEPQK